MAYSVVVICEQEDMVQPVAVNRDEGKLTKITRDEEPSMQRAEIPSGSEPFVPSAASRENGK
jgi:hypothetical protein